MKTKVLAMDDSLTVRSVIKSTLQNNGYDVYVVSNGEEGIQKAEEISPDVILVDFIMPKMNGYQVCKKLKSEEQFEKTPIILITARGEEVGKTFSEKFNVSYFIKPFRPSELLEKLEEVTKGTMEKELIAEEMILEEIEHDEELTLDLDTVDSGEAGLANLSGELSLPDSAEAPSSDVSEDLDQLLNSLSFGNTSEYQATSHEDAMAAPTVSEPLSKQDMPKELTLDSLELELPSSDKPAAVEQVKSPSQDINELKEDTIGTSFDDLSLHSKFKDLEIHGEIKSDELQLDDNLTMTPKTSLDEGIEIPDEPKADETLILGKEEQISDSEPSDDSLNIQKTSADTVSIAPMDKNLTEAKAEISLEDSSDTIQEIIPPSDVIESPVEHKDVSSGEHIKDRDNTLNDRLEHIKDKEIASHVSEVVSRYLINYFESNFLERIEQSLTNNINKYFIRNAATKLPLSGDISHFPVSSILKVIIEARLKGVLNIFSSGQFAEVSIADGRIVSANSNKKTKWSFIGQILKKESKITEKQLAEALEKSIAERVHLGKVMIEKGFVSADDIKSVLKRQVIAVVRSLIESKKGRFFFEETEKFTDMPLSLTYNDIISYKPENDEMPKESSEDWRLIYQRISGKDVYIGVISDINEIRNIGLKADELKIYAYLDGTKDLDTVVKQSGLSYFDVYKTIYSLINQGLIKNLTRGS